MQAAKRLTTCSITFERAKRFHHGDEQLAATLVAETWRIAHELGNYNRAEEFLRIQLAVIRDLKQRALKEAVNDEL